jgi:hypothetical protein
MLEICLTDKNYRDNHYESKAITKTLTSFLGFFKISQAMALIVFPVVKTSVSVPYKEGLSYIAWKR